VAEAGKQRDRVTPILVAVLLVGTVLLGWQEATDTALLREGLPAPDFGVKTPEGTLLTRRALEGEVVLLDFWATWCGPCREEMPMLLEVAEAYQARGVRLVLVNNDDRSEQREAVAAAIRQEPRLAGRVAYGEPGLDQLFLVRSLPTLYVLDRQGKVSTARSGAVPRWQLERWIEQALARELGYGRDGP
jgi:thiol-disulfide isomerase/thioredoxin